MREPWKTVAFRVCRDIGCPHPSKLESIGVGINEIADWWAFYLVENGDSEDTDSDVSKMAKLADFKEQWGG